MDRLARRRGTIPAMIWSATTGRRSRRLREASWMAAQRSLRELRDELRVDLCVVTPQAGQTMGQAS